MSKGKPQPVAFTSRQQKIVDIHKFNKDLKSSEADFRNSSRTLIKFKIKITMKKSKKPSILFL